jgi:hypothetical protein
VKDPLSSVLLAIGFASLLLATEPLSIIAAAMLSAGLVGLHRVTQKRAPLVLIALVVAIWVLRHFWDLVPVDSYKLSSEHDVLYAAPSFSATVALVAFCAAVPIVARSRTGNGLMVLTLASLAMAVIAKGPLLVLAKEDLASDTLRAMESGWFGVAERLVAIVFFASAFEPTTTRLEKRGLVIVGVIGACLFAAVYMTLPEKWVHGIHGVLASGALALSLVLSAIGFAGVAKSGGGAASWVAMALSILQIPMLVFGLVLSDKSASVMGAVGSTMMFILLAIGLAGVTAPSSLPARAARGFAGILALSALFGTLSSFALLLCAMLQLFHVREPYGPLHRFAIPIVGHAAVAWAACLAYLVAPPSDRVAG